MKKFLILFFSILLFTSCVDNESYKEVNVRVTDTGEYINIRGCRYYKIKIGNHDVYQYKYNTYTDTGSDIIHFEDLCNYCKTK